MKSITYTTPIATRSIMTDKLLTALDTLEIHRETCSVGFHQIVQVPADFEGSRDFAPIYYLKSQGMCISESIHLKTRDKASTSSKMLSYRITDLIRYSSSLNEIATDT